MRKYRQSVYSYQNAINYHSPESRRLVVDESKAETGSANLTVVWSITELHRRVMYRYDSRGLAAAQGVLLAGRV